jgi:hypothetical protein
MVVTPTCISISSWQCITVRILHLSKTCMLHGERVITVMQLIFTSMPNAHGERSLLIRSAQEEISEIYILINVAFTCRPAAAHSPWPLLRPLGFLVVFGLLFCVAYVVIFFFLYVFGLCCTFCCAFTVWWFIGNIRLSLCVAILPQ